MRQRYPVKIRGSNFEGTGGPNRKKKYGSDESEKWWPNAKELSTHASSHTRNHVHCHRIGNMAMVPENRWRDDGWKSR